jgi:hypothetical protein
MFFRDKLNVFIGHGILFKSAWCLGAKIDRRRVNHSPRTLGEEADPVLQYTFEVSDVQQRSYIKMTESCRPVSKDLRLDQTVTKLVPGQFHTSPSEL